MFRFVAARRFTASVVLQQVRAGSSSSTRDDFSSDSEDEKSEASQTSYPRDRNDPQWLTNNRKRRQSVRRESRKAEVIATLKRLLSNAAAALPRPPSDPFKRRIVMADPQWDQTQKRLAIYITTSVDIFGGSSVAHAKATRGYLSSSYFIRGDGNMSDSSRRTALTSLYDKGPPPFRFYVTTGQRRKPVPVELASLSTEQANLSGGGHCQGAHLTTRPRLQRHRLRARIIKTSIILPMILGSMRCWT